MFKWAADEFEYIVSKYLYFVKMFIDNITIINQIKLSSHFYVM